MYFYLQADGEYLWIDGFNVLYTNWGENEPSMEDGGGCVALHVDGTWKDDLCANIYGYVCKSTTGGAFVVARLSNLKYLCDFKTIHSEPVLQALFAK